MYIFAILDIILFNCCMIGCQCTYLLSYCCLVYLLYDRVSVYIFAIRGVVLCNCCMIGRQCTYLLSLVLSDLTTV